MGHWISPETLARVLEVGVSAQQEELRGTRNPGQATQLPQKKACCFGSSCSVSKEDHGLELKES